MERRFYRRRCNESRGDEFDGWGHSVWYFEVDRDGWPVRQVEAYDTGPVLRYGLGHEEDQYGGLGQVSLNDSDEDWSDYRSTETSSNASGNRPMINLGMAALHLGMLDVAVLDLEDALRVCRDAGAAGYAVEAGYLLASAHARCGGPDRRQRALALVKECAQAAAALGMAPSARPSPSWPTSLPAGGARPGSPSGSTRSPAVSPAG